MSTTRTPAARTAARPSAGRSELVEGISRELDTTQRDSAAILKGVVAALQDALRVHGCVRVPDLGTFRVVKTGPRAGRNPRTGESVPIEAGSRVTYRAARQVKSTVST